MLKDIIYQLNKINNILQYIIIIINIVYFNIYQYVMQKLMVIIQDLCVNYNK